MRMRRPAALNLGLTFRIAGERAVFIAIIRAGAHGAFDAVQVAKGMVGIEVVDVVFVDLQQELDVDERRHLDVELDVVEIVIAFLDLVFPVRVLLIGLVRAHLLEVVAIRVEPAVGEQNMAVRGLDRLAVCERHPFAFYKLERDGDVFRKVLKVVGVREDKEAQHVSAFGDILEVDPCFFFVIALNIVLHEEAGERIAVDVSEVVTERILKTRIRHDVGDLNMQFLDAFGDLVEKVVRVRSIELVQNGKCAFTFTRSFRLLGLIVGTLDVDALLQLDMDALLLVRNHDFRDIVLNLDLNHAARGQAIAILDIESDVDEQKFFIVQIVGEVRCFAVQAILGRCAVVDIVKQRECDFAKRIGIKIVA